MSFMTPSEKFKRQKADNSLIMPSDDELLTSFSGIFDRRRLTLEEVKSVFMDARDCEVMSSLRP